MNILVVGLGAIGSNIVPNLVFNQIDVIGYDKDVVEQKNLSTQFYGVSAIGAPKVDAMFISLFDVFGKQCSNFTGYRIDITEIKFAAGLKYNLVIDACDNIKARNAIQEIYRDHLEVLHLGFSPQQVASAVWKKDYRPEAFESSQGNDVCDLPAMRYWILGVCGYFTRTILKWIEKQEAGAFTNFSSYLMDRDFQIVEL